MRREAKTEFKTGIASLKQEIDDFGKRVMELCDDDDTESTLPKPGHVWYRHPMMRPDGDWWPGVISQNGELVLDNGMTVEEIGAYDILPAHTTPPDATITKDELFRRIDEHDTLSCSYCGSTKEVRNDYVCCANEICSRYVTACRQCLLSRYYDVRCGLHREDTASLPTLRSAADFTEKELIEIRRAYQETPVHSMADFRAVAAKSIEIAKRGTS